MIDPIIAGSLIKGGTAILGGLMGSNGDSARDVRKQNVKQQREFDQMRPTWIRQGAEAAGFNPLLFAGPLGAAPGLSGAGPSNVMGDALARAGAAVADGFGQAADLDMQKAELELERQRVEALAENLKLRPKVPGVYGTGGDKPAEEAENILDVTPSTVTNAMHVDTGSYVDSRSPDAEMGETRYGDIFQELSGGLNIARDILFDRKMQQVVKAYGRDVADEVYKTYSTDRSLSLDESIEKHTKGLTPKTDPKDRPVRAGRNGSGPLKPATSSKPKPQLSGRNAPRY